MALDEHMRLTIIRTPNTAPLHVAIRVEKQRPDIARQVVAVDIRANEPWDFTATIHKTPNDRATFTMIMQCNRGDELAEIATGLHAIVALHRFPAVVATLDH